MKDGNGPMTKEDRRKFLKRASKASMAVPATALLLSVTRKRAYADGYGYGMMDNDSDNDSDSNPW